MKRDINLFLKVFIKEFNRHCIFKNEFNQEDIMLKKIRDKLFYIGTIIFSLTLITEQLFLGETNITSFLKGFASSILLIGVVILFKNRKTH